MKVLSVGDRVEAGRYRLHSRFQRAANYTAGSRLVVLSDRSVGSGPINIVLDGAPPEADALTVESESLLIAGGRHSFGPRYDSSMPPGPVNPAMIAVLADHLRARAHPKSLAFLLDEGRIPAFRAGFEQNLVKQIQDGVAGLFGPDPAEGARRLRGCGFGLTPSGDDLLAGVLMGGIVVGRPSAGGVNGPPGTEARPTRHIHDAARGEHVLSNAFLDLAWNGRVNEAMKQLVTTLMGDAPEKTREAADRVLAQGETSGADILTGLVLAMQKGNSTSNAQQPTSNVP